MNTLVVSAFSCGEEEEEEVFIYFCLGEIKKVGWFLDFSELNIVDDRRYTKEYLVLFNLQL